MNYWFQTWKKPYQSIPIKNIKDYYWTIVEQSDVNSKDWEQIYLESNAAVFYLYNELAS